MLQVNNLKKEAEISKTSKFMNLKSNTQADFSCLKPYHDESCSHRDSHQNIENNEKRTLGGNLDCLISEFLNLR